MLSIPYSYVDIRDHKRIPDPLHAPFLCRLLPYMVVLLYSFEFILVHDVVVVVVVVDDDIE